MTGSKQWADKIIGDIKRVAEAIPSAGPSPSVSAGSAPAMSPQAVAAALAEAMKSDNATTQAIAIRAANLASRYPQRAF